MVKTKKRDAEVKQIVLDLEEVERPTSNRGKWDADPSVEKSVRSIIETAKTGKALRLRISEAELVHRLNMHYRNLVKKEGLTFSYRKIDENTLVAWAHRVKETGK